MKKIEIVATTGNGYSITGGKSPKHKKNKKFFYIKSYEIINGELIVDFEDFCKDDFNSFIVILQKEGLKNYFINFDSGEIIEVIISEFVEGVLKCKVFNYKNNSSKSENSN